MQEHREVIKYPPYFLLAGGNHIHVRWFIGTGSWHPLSIAAIRQGLAPGSFYLVVRLWRRMQIMSVSVSAVQLRILVVAIAVTTVGQLVVVSIGDGRAANGASIAKPPIGAFTAARGGLRKEPNVEQHLFVFESQNR
jgi:hypothetical protein